MKSETQSFKEMPECRIDNCRLQTKSEILMVFGRAGGGAFSKA